jgi:hypothetical protein
MRGQTIGMNMTFKQATNDIRNDLSALKTSSLLHLLHLHQPLDHAPRYQPRTTAASRKRPELRSRARRREEAKVRTKERAREKAKPAAAEAMEAAEAEAAMDRSRRTTGHGRSPHLGTIRSRTCGTTSHLPPPLGPTAGTNRKPADPHGVQRETSRARANQG